MNAKDVNAQLSAFDVDEQAGSFGVPMANMMQELGAAVTILQDAGAFEAPEEMAKEPVISGRVEGVLKNKGGDWVKISAYGDDPTKVLHAFMLAATHAQLDYDFALNANELATKAAGAQPVPYTAPAPVPSANLSPNMQPAPSAAAQSAPPPPMQQVAGAGGGTNLITYISISVNPDGKTFLQVFAQGLQYPLKDSRNPALVLKAFDPTLLIENGGFWSAERLATPGSYSQNGATNPQGIIVQQAWGGFPLYVDWVKDSSSGKTYYNISKIHR